MKTALTLGYRKEPIMMTALVKKHKKAEKAKGGVLK